MSLKARLRRPIVALVALIVVVMSLLYLSDFTRISFQGAADRADLVGEQFKLYLANHLNLEMNRHGMHPVSVADWENGWTEIIRRDPDITDMLNRTLGQADLALAILVTDRHGDILAASPAGTTSRVLASAEDIHQIQSRTWIVNLWDLLMRRQNYLVTRPIGFQGSREPLFNITIVIRSVLLLHQVEPALKSLTLAFALALCVAIVLGAVLPNLILDPLQRVSHSIDLIRTGQFGASPPQDRREAREFADVHSKLTLLDEQYRGAKQDASELRTNIEQLLQRLEESVLLFDHTGRLLMAGEPAARLLGRTHASLEGSTLDELFPESSALGAMIASAVRGQASIEEQKISVPRSDGPPQRLAVGVQILRKNESRETMGVLVTMRDVESRRQLERQLDVSTRLAAISRLTGGVAHEIKNPLNAMALHLEVLKSKLTDPEPEIDVIGREIKRLDTVVKTFLNFNRPMELHYQPIELSELVREVLSLVSVQAGAKGIRIESSLAEAVWISADPDLLRQAILNVINNGMEAMNASGSLIARTEFDGDDCVLTVSDAGPGIPAEIQNRVFQLYFTTKENGSGIGLATTFRVVQLHNGTIDFTSEPGKGTTFRLRFPRMVDHQQGALASATSTS